MDFRTALNAAIVPP